MQASISLRAVLTATLAFGAAAATAQQSADSNVAASRAAKTKTMRTIPDQTARRWTSADQNRSTLATLVEANETTARFKKSDGRMATVELNKLTPPDAAYIDVAFRAASVSSRREAPRRPATRLITTKKQSSEQKSATDSGANESKDEAPSFGAAKPPGWLDAITAPKLPTAADLRDFIARRQAASSLSNRPLPANVIYIRFSDSFLRQYMHRELRRQTTVTDNILGTPIQGTADYAATTRLELAPNDDHAEFKLHLVGTVQSSTIGYSGPVRIHSDGNTQFVSTKLLTSDGRGMQADNATTTAETHSHTRCIDTDVPGLRGRIVRRVAARRVEESRVDADLIAARHTEARINRQFDETVKERLASMAKGINGPFGMFAANATDPEAPRNRLYATTTSEYLQIMILSRDALKKEFVPEPQRLAQRPEIELHVHSSVIGQAMSELQWQAILRPVVNILLAQRAIRGGAQTSSGMQTEWHLQYSEGAEWVTLVWNSEPANLAKAKSPASGSAAAARVAARK